MVQDKYSSNKYGNATGLRMPPQDPITGLYLQHGNNCEKHDNCFTCPFPNCTWDASNFHKIMMRRKE